MRITRSKMKEEHFFLFEPDQTKGGRRHKSSSSIGLNLGAFLVIILGFKNS